MGKRRFSISAVLTRVFDGVRMIILVSIPLIAFYPQTAFAEQYAIPSSIQATGAPVLDGKIWIVSSTVEIQVAGLYAFDPAGCSWTRRADIEVNRFGGCLLAAGDALYRIGGGRIMVPENVGHKSARIRKSQSAVVQGAQTGQVPVAVAEVGRYVPARNRWEPLQSMPHPRMGFSACAVGDKIYVFGGRSFYGYSEVTRNLPDFLAEVDEFDIRTGKWRTVGESPVQWHFITAIPEGNGILLLGNEGHGYRGPGKSIRYNPARNEWSQVDTLPTQSNYSPIVVSCDATGMITIWNQEQGFLYDRINSSWVPVEPPPEFSGWGGLSYPPQRKRVSQAAAINGIVYAFGGPYGGGLDSLDTYDPVAKSWKAKPIRARWPVKGGSSSYLEGERYADNDTGTWSWHRKDGSTIFEDVRAVLGAQLGSSTGMERLSAFEGDLDGDGKDETMFLATPGYDNNTLFIYGSDQRWWWTQSLGGLWPEVSGRLRPADPPMLAAHILVGGSADVSFWQFYRWTEGRLMKVLASDIQCGDGRPQFNDLDGDGYNEIIFEAGGKYMERVPAQIFTWDKEMKEYVSAAERFPAYWQAIIDKELPLFRGMKPGGGMYASSYRLAHAFNLRGGIKDKEILHQLVREKLGPILANDRNDHDQGRAGQILSDVETLLNKQVP